MSSVLLKFIYYTIMTIYTFLGDLPSFSPHLTSHSIHLLNLISRISCVGTVGGSPGTELRITAVAPLHMPGVETRADCSELNKAQNHAA